VASEVEPDGAKSAAVRAESRSQARKLDEGLSFSGYERDFLALNVNGQRFEPISGVSGADSVTDGRAAVYADFDNDGDHDILLRVAHNKVGQLLFRNNVGQDAGFLRVALRGRESGRDAFGAVVRVKTSAGILTQVKAGGSGFLSQHDPRLLFGLGRDAKTQGIEVRWPSGRNQSFPGLPAGASVLIVEGEPAPRQVRERRFRLPDALSAEERRWRAVRLKPGAQLPPLELKTLDGKIQPLSALLDPGHTTVVNFWATWCDACKQEMPELQRLHDKNGLRVVGISVDEGGNDLALMFVRRFQQLVGVTYPVYWAGPEVRDQVFAGGGVSVPLSLVVDGEGRLVEVLPGSSLQTHRRLAELSAPAR